MSREGAAQVTHASLFQRRGRLPSMTPDTEWAGELMAPFPLAWAKRLMRDWDSERFRDRTGANLALLQRSKLLRKAWGAGIQPDASDSDIVARAKEAARDAVRRLQDVERICTGAFSGESIVVAKLWHVRAWLDAMSLGDQWARLRKAKEGAACLLRVQCETWWRRVLRVLHARTAEACAIDLRLVHKRGECYVSTDGVKARRGQVARNAGILERTHAVNDEGQAYTLAELAATGPANAEIRRAELMTRIAGFELIGRDCQHVADFITVTCPSRMHSMRTAGQWHTEPNPSYDGTKPDEAQKHLAGQWAKCRAYLQRHKAPVYGFRITEPNHDGTPHWHLLLFYPPHQTGVVRGAMKRYFLDLCDPHEKGASKHRVTVERIDPARGSAAGYVAKYVGKNIDGYKVEKDLYGNDAIVASQRVQAWASRWRIRQFQQVGGAPVTVWRELRRINPQVLDGEEADTLHAALKACNTSGRAKESLNDEGQRHTSALGWRDYVRLQGGPLAGRRGRRLVLEKHQSGELGRYGEAVAAKPIGIVAAGVRIELVSVLHRTFEQKRPTITLAQSERSDWIVVPGVSLAEAREIALARGEASRPWTRVNNCTAEHGLGLYDAHPEAMFGLVRQVRPKLGHLKKPNGGVRIKESDHEPPTSRATVGPAGDRQDRGRPSISARTGA